MDEIVKMPARAVKFGDRIHGPYVDGVPTGSLIGGPDKVLALGPERGGSRVRLWTGPDSHWSVPRDAPVAVRIPPKAVELRRELSEDYPEGCWAIELLGGPRYCLCTGEADHEGPHNLFGVPFNSDRTAA